MINEIHDSSLHMCADLFPLSSNFLFSRTKWHARWDMILLPSLLRFYGRHKILHDWLVLALHWMMFAVDISFSLRYKAGKCLSLDDRLSNQMVRCYKNIVWLDMMFIPARVMTLSV
jgi:hypothetical protein